MTQKTKDVDAYPNSGDATTSLETLFAALTAAGNNVSVNVHLAVPPSPSAQSPRAGPDAGQGVPSSPPLVNEPTAAAENEEHVCICRLCERHMRGPAGSDGASGASVPSDNVTTASAGGDCAGVGAVSSRWYLVTVGRQTGVFKDWAAVSPLVVGVGGACYTRHSSRGAAQAAFTRAREAGHVHVTP